MERTQPSLPLGPGHIRIETHDNIRHGMITLFAALNYLDGKLIYRTEWKHPHVEWLRILKQTGARNAQGHGYSFDSGKLRHAQAGQG